MYFLLEYTQKNLLDILEKNTSNKKKIDSDTGAGGCGSKLNNKTVFLPITFFSSEITLKFVQIWIQQVPFTLNMNFCENRN